MAPPSSQDAVNGEDDAQHSGGLSKVSSPDPDALAGTEPAIADTAGEVEAAQQNQTTNDKTQEHDTAGDEDLGAQLQQSAQGTEMEDEDTADDVEDETTPAEAGESSEAQEAVNGDITMQDAEEEVDDQEGDKDEEDTSGEEQSSNEQEDVRDDADATSQASADIDTKSDAESGSDASSEDENDADQVSESSEEESETENKNCVFCNQSEENDPSEDFETYLTCSNCNNHAHQQCARDNESMKDGDDPTTWQCLTCAGPKNESESPKSVLARARNSNSAPRLVRDLLPVSRGVQKPNSHSIFAQPLISDDEDGGRSLRKRKSPTHDPPSSGKKRRKATPHKPKERSQEPERAVAHSTRRASAIQKTVPTARILQHRPFHKPPPHKFILAFRLDQEKIANILSKPPRPGKRRDRKKLPKLPPPPVYQPPVPKFPALPTNHLIFPSIFHERENELNAKPYGGILSEQEADTTRSLPQLRDREIFENARKEAEEERRRASTAAEAEIVGDNTLMNKPNRTVSGPPSKIKCIQFGKFVIDTFYAAPYPEEYSHESRLFICEFCLKYLPSEFVAYRHKLKCPAKHPPGDEIYRDGSISIWEVDGRKKTEYCQCLCLMAKMFLGSKTLYYDVEPFLFYILTEYDELGYHFVGYFSKEKRPASQNNVSCILVMPIHQRKGYATFLIDFSYLLTRIEGKEGSPEKPLSDMGLTAYRSYWDLTISRHLLDLGFGSFSTKTLMARTGMTADDVIHSLERLYAFTRDPVTKTYAIRYDKKLYENIVADYEAKSHRNLRPEYLVWTPYIMGRSDQATLDSQPLHTVAPREEEIEEESQDSKSRLEVDTGQVSPKTSTRTSRLPSEAIDDAPVDDLGVVAPGPPPTEPVTAAETEPKVNGIHPEEIPTINLPDESLTGYALAYRTLNIPATRFQIEPPIPPAMLRQRSMKKRPHGAAFGNRSTANASPAPLPTATRSSPRNSNGVNGSSPEKPSTPVRRSGRKSGLANVESLNLDGTVDEKDESEDSDANEVEADDEQGSGEEDSSGEESEEVEESEPEVEEEDDDGDPDAVVEEDEESSSAEEDEGDEEEESAEAEETTEAPTPAAASTSALSEDAEGESDE